MTISIGKGKKAHAIRTVVYGVEGIGKTTLVSHWPDPLFIDTENGSYQIDVKRFDGVETWKDVTDAIDYVISNPTVCQTLVLDTADKAEQMLSKAICEETGKDSIEKVGGGYGKGYTILQERFQQDLLGRMDRVIAKGIHVVIVAHSTVRTITPPDADPYDHYELKCSKKVTPLLKEWCDMLLFCNYDITVIQGSNGKGKAVGDGKRVMHANHMPTYDAKNRFNLPDTMPLDYEQIRSVIDGNVPKQKEKTELVLDGPNKIMEGDDGFEDPRDILERRINKAGIETLTLEAWLVATGRLAPGGHLSDLSATQAKAMYENIDLLIDQLTKKKED